MKGGEESPAEHAETVEASPHGDSTLDPGGASLHRLLIGGVLLVLVILYVSLESGEVRHGPGVLAPGEPYQTDSGTQAGWEMNGVRITPLAYFRMRARVLGTERYWFDAGSRISPVDFALGWGPMSDDRILEQLDMGQGGRWYHWSPRGKTFPIAKEDIIKSSANMHMIPANEEIKGRLLSVRRGQIVTLSGYLVAAETKEGWKWRSSLSRTDTGAGACELVWVKEVSAR
jgi:hypothetical protein